jgi:integrase/recombinase XerD
MPKKGHKSAKAALPGDARDPAGLVALLAAYLTWLRERNYSEATVLNRTHYVGEFIKWCHERGLARPSEVMKPVLESYQRWLFHYRQKQGKPLSVPSQLQRLLPVRAWFKWLCRQNHLMANPAADLDLPRGEKRLPKHILNATEVERVLAGPDVSDPLGLRDRAILEVFYSTGMRRMELLNLKLHDLDAERGTVMVRQGKGKKDRMIPMGARAFAWVARYAEEARPKLLAGPDDGTVFLTSLGGRFEPGRLTQLVRDTVRAADTGKSGACHLFRHTCATLMLENGADIRFIQQQLGHAELSTTQIYTQVSIRMLKEVHTRTHPAALPSPELRPVETADAAEHAANNGSPLSS